MRVNFPDRRTLLRFLPVVLMAMGIGLLVYVGVQYAEMYLEQHRLAREWERQQVRPADGKHAADAKAAAVEDGLSRLSIPKINLNAVVVEGTSRKALLLGPGHLKDTPEPGLPGNAVITGHRDTFFRHVYELNKGDRVTVQRSGKIYMYEVTGKKIVDPDDVSVIQPSRDNRLTLITCYPTYYIGPAPERLVVFSKLMEQPNPPTTQAQGEPRSDTATR